ncbi:DUF1932 domain-containing protein [Streptomyces sp. NPDC021080]|uniref:DUF1932 domain-containing protein n=1 Tax=Streptomyces sp. NPDC021080 TaxID=3365110 RepID=UPI0037A1DCB6
MRVDPEREAGVRVPQVGAQRLDVLARVQKHRRVESSSTAAIAHALAGDHGVEAELLDIAEGRTTSYLAETAYFPKVAARSWRWAPETKEAARALEETRLPSDLAAAAVMRRWAGLKDTSPDLALVLEGLHSGPEGESAWPVVPGSTSMASAMPGTMTSGLRSPSAHSRPLATQSVRRVCSLTEPISTRRRHVSDVARSGKTVRPCLGSTWSTPRACCGLSTRKFCGLPRWSKTARTAGFCVAASLRIRCQSCRRTPRYRGIRSWAGRHRSPSPCRRSPP